MCCSNYMMTNNLKDYGLNNKNIKIICDNVSAINLIKNPINHSRTKHIYRRYISLYKKSYSKRRCRIIIRWVEIKIFQYI